MKKLIKIAVMFLVLITFAVPLIFIPELQSNCDYFAQYEVQWNTQHPETPMDPKFDCSVALPVSYVLIPIGIGLFVLSLFLLARSRITTLQYVVISLIVIAMLLSPAILTVGIEIFFSIPLIFFGI